MEKIELLLDDKINTVNESKRTVYKDLEQRVSKAQKENEKNTMVHKNSKELNITNTSNEDDRYLTADEINTLTSLLQTVKKSDVEAILEVYNLAQDIYKEIDKNADRSVVDDLQNTRRPGKDFKIEEQIKSEPNDHTSYWYEPLSHSNTKEKVVQIDTAKLVPVLPPNPKKETHVVPVPPIVMTKPKDEDTLIEGTPKSTEAVVPNYSYFMGPLSNSHFRKLPYYYPMPGIQKQGKYSAAQGDIHQLPGAPRKIGSIKTPANIESLTSITAEFPVTKKSFAKIPCKQEHFKHTTGGDILTKKTTMPKDKISFMDNPKALLAPFTAMYKKSPTALPYPFAYVHYNLSSIPNAYFNANPFHLYNIRPQKPINKKAELPQNPKYVSSIPNAILINPDLNGDIDINEQKPLDVILRQEKKVPAWQSAPLSQSILNDIKPNVVSQSNLPSFPMTKKVKLERANKIRMDELKRSVRDTMKEDHEVGKEESEKFEMYIEKST